MARKKSLSIIDVAASAGVSRSTVSRVINNDSRVSSAAVDSVHQAMTRLGYSPPPMEKRYRRPSRKPQGIRHGQVALFFPDTNPEAEQTPLSTALIHGASRALASQRLRLLVTHQPGPGLLPEVILRREVDGVLVRGGDLPDDLLRKIKVVPPVWLLESRHHQLWGDQVAPDNHAVGELAGQWMLDSGARHLFILNPDPLHPAFKRRVEFCRAFLADCGQEVSVLSGEEAQPAAALKRITASSGRVALFSAGHDATLLNLYMALITAGLRCGDQIAMVACVSRRSPLRTLDPHLAKVDIQPEVIARTAVETLLWRMRNPREPGRKIEIAPQLVCGPFEEA